MDHTKTYTVDLNSSRRELSVRSLGFVAIATVLCFLGKRLFVCVYWGFNPTVHSKINAALVFSVFCPVLDCDACFVGGAPDWSMGGYFSYAKVRKLYSPNKENICSSNLTKLGFDCSAIGTCLGFHKHSTSASYCYVVSSATLEVWCYLFGTFDPSTSNVHCS